MPGGTLSAMKVRLTKAGGQFGGEQTVEIAEGTVECTGGTTDFRREVPEELHTQLVSAVQRVLEV